MRLRYHGAHRGDHPAWIYRKHIAVVADMRAGEPVWRRSYRFEHIQITGTGEQYEGEIVVDQRTLAPLEGFNISGDDRRQLAFFADRVEQVSIKGDGSREAKTTPVQEQVVTDPWLGLDLYVLNLPLRIGLQQRFHMFDSAPKPLRPFQLSVDRIERITVPAGAFDTFRVTIEPLEGGDRLKSLYHVSSSGERLVVRREYIVIPKSEGIFKRSVGVEELEAIEPSEPITPR